MNVTDLISIEQLDADDAIGETAAAVGIDRADFFKKAGLAVGGVAAGSAFFALPSLASAATLPKSDIAILNFAYTLELLESDFYTKALKANFPEAVGQFTKLVQAHEATHVKTLKKVLGSKAVKKPTFDFGNATSNQPAFQKLAFALENTGVHAYLGQAGKIKTPAILAAAASIVTIEARHAAVIGTLNNGQNPLGSKGATPSGAFDTPFSKSKVLAAAGKYIKS